MRNIPTDYPKMGGTSMSTVMWRGMTCSILYFLSADMCKIFVPAHGRIGSGTAVVLLEESSGLDRWEVE